MPPRTLPFFAEVRTRINGLFFLVLGATLVQLLSKVTV